MSTKYLSAGLIAASLVVIPAEPVRADAKDFIAGAIIGGVIGANAKKQRRTTSAPRRSYTKKTVRRSSIPATQQGREVQASLNYFGFNAGTVDGQLGRKTRDAVTQYQAYMGYPVTGNLSPFELNLLTSSYNRAQAGGMATQSLVAANIDGTRGLLKSFRAEMAGQSPATAGVMATAPAPAQMPAITSVAAGVATGGAALPAFLGAGNQASLAAHCNQVSLITNTNGGFVTQASMSDPNTALNEQFCLARTYAIARSEEMAANVPGFTPDQIAAQCAGFAPVMKPYVASLAQKSRDDVARDVAGFAAGSGMVPSQLAGTARICMGVGYRTDNLDVAIGSALVLYALGEPVYGELIGHHLAQGYGPLRRVDLAGPWYDAALTALDNGAVAVFNPGQPERKALLRQAAARLGGAPALPVLPQAQPAATLPMFSISE